MSALDIKLTPGAGALIDDCAQEAIALAQFLKRVVAFDFNDTHVNVFADDSVEDVCKRYFKARELDDVR